MLYSDSPRAWLGNGRLQMFIFILLLSGSSVAPSATNIVLVALTAASIMALVGVGYLGRKATKIVNNPYKALFLIVPKTLLMLGSL